MMSRQEFMERLKAELSRLPSGEVEDILSYYEEYFEDAGSENEAAVIRELGSPARIASQMKANYAVKQIDDKKSKGKGGISAIWWVFLGLLAAPVALPLVFIMGVLLFAVVITVLALAFAALLTIGSLFVAGILFVIGGIVTIGKGGLATALVGIGSGIALIGSMALAGFAVILLVRWLFNVIAKSVNKRRQQKALDREIAARKAVRFADREAKKPDDVKPAAEPKTEEKEQNQETMQEAEQKGEDEHE